MYSIQTAAARTGLASRFLLTAAMLSLTSLQGRSLPLEVVHLSPSCHLTWQLLRIPVLACALAQAMSTPTSRAEDVGAARARTCPRRGQVPVRPLHIVSTVRLHRACAEADQSLMRRILRKVAEVPLPVALMTGHGALAYEPSDRPRAPLRRWSCEPS